MKHQRILIIALLMMILLVVPAGASAQSDNRSLYWARWDVEISNIDTTANSFHVVETHVLQITTGPINGGDREIPLDRITSIDNIRLSDGKTPLRPVNSSADNCPSTRGIVCLSRSGGQQVIYYNFTSAAQSGSTRTITYEYDVRGALRAYPGGDQLWWSALAPDRPFPVQDSRVTVQLPPGLKLDKVETDPPTWRSSTEGNPLVFEAPGSLGTSGNVEIRLQWPHNPALVVAPWQANFDRQVALEPLFSLIMLIVTPLIAIGGPLWVFLRYSAHKRGLPPIVVPEYLTEPPSDQPPAVVGTLVNSTSNTTDVMATLFDLARRGFMVIEQEQHHGLFNNTPEFTFHRTEQPETGLRPYEQMLLRALFVGGDTRKLSDLRNRFYTTVDAIKAQLYTEVVNVGYFKQSPQSVRSGWVMAGIGLITLAVLGVGVALSSKLPLGLSGLLPFPFGAIGFVGLVMMFVSGMMPTRTAAGMQEAEKWKAFRNYLKNINKYTDIKQATDQFERYIGYAISFGLDKQWINQFSSVLTSMPHWYYPTYMYGPWTGRYPTYGRGNYGAGLNTIGGNPTGGNAMGQISGQRGGGLNAMSNNMTEGLAAMSGGLTSLLNSASSTMTSRPSSSGSSGGFSGGGSSGGSSGGGHAGFH